MKGFKMNIRALLLVVSASLALSSLHGVTIKNNSRWTVVLKDFRNDPSANFPIIFDRDLPVELEPGEELQIEYLVGFNAKTPFKKYQIRNIDNDSEVVVRSNGTVHVSSGRYQQ